MNKQTFSQKMAVMPLPAHFLYTSIIFGLLTWLQHRYTDHQHYAHPVQSAVIEGLFFGAFMTLFIAISRRRLQKKLGSPTAPQQQFALARAIRKGELPTDPALVKLLPNYIPHQIKVLRRMRIIGPIEFGLFTILGISLAISDHTVVWLIYALLFAAFGIYAVMDSQKRLNNIQKMGLQPKSTK